MGKILETTYHDTVNSITNFYTDLINNPFYVLNDKKPTIVTYYNTNKDYTSVDPGSKIQYDNIGKDSPIRYNRIYDFILYGFQRIELNTDVDDFGVEANKIEGEAYILPNTIIPYEGDYFEVEHIKDSTWMFIVKDVQKDTLDNGSNVYKISYKLEYDDHNKILDHIVYNFRMVEVREGTNIVSIVRDEDLKIAKLMDEKAVMLKSYYNDLFYDENTQTFLFHDLTGYNIYDPYMIEFLIRNKILSNGEDSYVYVDHKIPVHKTFSIEYDKTFFRMFEKKNKDGLMKSIHTTSIEEIDYYGSIFNARYDAYWRTMGIALPGYTIHCLDDKLIYKIQDNDLEKFDDSNDNPDMIWLNILIKYFNDENITEDEINALENIQFDQSTDAFYIIPLLIFCLEKYIENALK